jgi:hypothetical protein
MTKGSLENQCLVVYLDVLGFAEIINEDISKIDDLLNVWHWIKNNCSKKDGVITYLFSDSTFVLYPLFLQNKIKPEMISRCINDTSKIMNEFLTHDFFVRGAISFGKVKFTGNLVAGKSVVNAVRYEEKYCPCPFVIFPSKEYNELKKMIELNSLIMPKINFYKDTINSKDEKEALNCNIILPTDDTKYVSLIEKNRNKYLTEGPFDKGKFWNTTYTIINNLINSEKKLEV